MNRLSAAIASVGLVGTAALAVPALIGPRWADSDIARVRGMSLEALPPLPADRSNRFADDPRAAALGKVFFFDTGFSANGAVACATCHVPEKGFQDGLPLGRGIGTAGRRTMPLSGVAYAPFLFWDGRKDSLWSQALGPLESAAEHGTDRTAVAHRVADGHRGEYESVFGPLPDLAPVPMGAGPAADTARASAWEALSADDRHAVDLVFANVGKAIEAYERTIPVRRTRFDAWVASTEFPAPGLLSEEEIAGLRLFIGEAECATCHNGPLFTDQQFHNIGVPDQTADQGRAGGAGKVQADAFNCLGAFSDALPDDCTELRFMAPAREESVGAFKTPSLRQVASRAPYTHTGQFATLSAVIDHYAAAPAAAIGRTELHAHSLDQRQKAQIEAFLKSLNAEGED